MLVELKDTNELALDPIKRPLRVPFGEAAWSWKDHWSACGGLAERIFEPGKWLGGTLAVAMA